MLAQKGINATAYKQRGITYAMVKKKTYHKAYRESVTRAIQLATSIWASENCQNII